MKIIKYIPILACLLLFGCDVIEERGKINSLNLIGKNEFVMMVENENKEVRPESFTYLAFNTNIHIYADIKEGESMWYEGAKIEGFGTFAWLKIHVRADTIKINLEKRED